MAYPKCKHYNHSRTKHVDYMHGNRLGVSFCWDCYNFGPTYEWEYDVSLDVDSETFNCYHNYYPDNLSYIEKLAERRGLV